MNRITVAFLLMCIVMMTGCEPPLVRWDLGNEDCYLVRNSSRKIIAHARKDRYGMWIVTYEECVWVRRSDTYEDLPSAQRAILKQCGIAEPKK